MDRTINDLLCATQSYNLSVVAYSLPSEAEFTIYIQNTLSEEPSIAEKEFWIAPFDTSTGYPFVKIKPHFILKENEAIPEFQKVNVDKTYWTLNESSFENFTESRYTTAVEELQKIIEKGELHKAAIAQLQATSLPENFNIWNLLQQVRKKLPNAFVSFISTPHTGTWIGATPELLLQQDADLIKTVALAGTRINNDATKWSKKEIEEQDYVTQHVSQVLNSLQMGDVSISELKETMIGNLAHLVREFSIKSSLQLTKETIEKIALALHPTPAVGGLPKLSSIQFIEQVEKYNRTYYAGFLGPVDKMSARLFVNLRCMTLLQKIGYFFGGAGITAESEPTKEWIETNNKIQLLRSLIG